MPCGCLLKLLDVFHVTATGREGIDKEGLQWRENLLLVKVALLIRLHVFHVVPQADSEASVFVVEVLHQPALPQSLDVLALGDHCCAVGLFVLAPFARMHSAPCNAHDHGLMSSLMIAVMCGYHSLVSQYHQAPRDAPHGLSNHVVSKRILKPCNCS